MASAIQREGFSVGDPVRFVAHGRQIDGVIRSFTGKAANQRYPFTVVANGDAYALRASDMMLVRDADETGWVIERGDSEPSAPTYWAGLDIWSQDHEDAVRFARAIDAERVSARMIYPNNRICEHIWTNASPCRDLIGVEEAAADLLESFDKDYRTVGYRNDQWGRLRAAIAKASA